MKLLSVILPAFNAAPFINDAVTSLLNQTYKDIEIIVIDDGSTDATDKVILPYRNLKYIRQHNLGAASARNKGILEATGQYIAFIDADDLWLPDKTIAQVNYLQESGLKWCYCDSYFSWFGKNDVIGKLSSVQGAYHGDILIPYISNKFEIPLPSTVIDRSVFDTVGLFDEALRTEEHTDLWSRIAIHYPIGYIDQPLVKIRKRVNSLSQTTSPEVTGDNRRYVLQKLLELAPEKIKPRYNELVAISYRYQGTHYLRRGEVSEARICFWKASRLKPTKIAFFIYWLACFFKPIPNAVYKIRWYFLQNKRANLNSGWWVNQKT
ncbi:MAG: glycosyltransferase family 2 protein [Anaerolineaceae bacterium]|nr:glycosyltransferase family 2 protein [Anaerolineaceae bacterium]